ASLAGVGASSLAFSASMTLRSGSVASAATASLASSPDRARSLRPQLRSTSSKPASPIAAAVSSSRTAAAPRTMRRCRRLGADDLDDPAAVALAVELDEEDALPGAERKLGGRDR